MEEIDFGEIQQVLDEILGNGTDFQQMVGQGMQGENILSFQSLGGMLQKIFLEELLAQKKQLKDRAGELLSRSQALLEKVGGIKIQEITYQKI